MRFSLKNARNITKYYSIEFGSSEVRILQWNFIRTVRRLITAGEVRSVLDGYIR